MSLSVFREELRQAIQRRRLEDADFQQNALSAVSGVSETHLSAILHGQRNPRTRTVRKLAGALGLNEEDSERWVLLCSLPADSKYALKPEDVKAMLQTNDADLIALLRTLVDLSRQQIALQERIVDALEK